MRKKTILNLLVIISFLLMACLFTGCIEKEKVDKYPSAEKINLDYSIVKQFIDIKQNEFEKAKKDLNIKAYGINDVTKEEILEWYNEKHKDWKVYKTENKSKTLDNFKIEGKMTFWTKLLWGKGVIVADGSLVKLSTGYNVIIVTTNSLVTTYQEYMDKF
ncbi:MAG: hypothetical protein V5A68_07040 [Candidatus Thermoplasmatota archaeon]